MSEARSLRLADHVALVTGAASGIGLATVRRFEAEGAAVAGVDIADRPTGDDAPAFGGGWHAVDVRDEDAVAAAVRSVVDERGRIDSVVSAAGVAGGGPVHLLPLEEWRRVLDVNLTGTMLVAKHVVAASMLERRAGSIINIASVEGLQGAEGGSAYNASKGGVVTLTKSMAMDYGRVGIRVNAICPGFVDTPLINDVFAMPGLEVHRQRLIELHQLGRLGQPVEIANAALFLASDESSFVTGSALVVDGGLTAGQRTGIADEILGLR